MNKIMEKRMTDSFEVKGKWSLAENDLDNSIEGILRYSPKEIVLELIGSFHSLLSIYGIEDRSKSTIYGFSEKGDSFTLFGCIPKSVYMNALGFDTCSYFANRFYIGTNFIKNEDEAIITEARFSFTNIDMWMDFPILEYQFNRECSKLGCMVEIDPSLSEKKKIDIPSLNMTLSEEYCQSLIYPDDFFLQEAATIKVNRFYCLFSRIEQGVSPQTMLTNMNQVRRLLALLLSREMYFTYIELHFLDKKTTSFNEGTNESKGRCRLFFKQVGDIEKAKHLTLQDMESLLLKRSNIKDDLDHIVNMWFEEQEKLGECVNAYISDLYLPAYVENKFLNIVRGIESYHRFFVEDSEGDKPQNLSEKTDFEEEYSKVIEYINANISEKNRGYFLSRINYADEMSLRKRLTHLFKLIPPQLLKRLFGDLTGNRKKKIISQIIDTRNYYTHRDEKRNYKNVVEFGPELMHFTSRLSILLQYFCLTQIGVDSTVAAQRLAAIAGRSGI